MPGCLQIGRGRASPSICWMGSPGTRWMRRNTTDTTSQTTGNVYKTRKKMWRSNEWVPGCQLSVKSVGVTVGSSNQRRVAPVSFTTVDARLALVPRLVHGGGLPNVDLHAGDAVPVHLFNRKAAAFVIEALPGAWNPL